MEIDPRVLAAVVSFLGGLLTSYLFGIWKQIGEIDAKHGKLPQLAEIASGESYASTRNAKEAELHVEQENLA